MGLVSFMLIGVELHGDIRVERTAVDDRRLGSLKAGRRRGARHLGEATEHLGEVTETVLPAAEEPLPTPASTVVSEADGGSYTSRLLEAKRRIRS